MKLKKTLLVTFSPTRTSYKIGEAIARGLGNEEIDIMDLTLYNDVPSIDISKETLVIFSLPVYGGSIAPLAMQRLSELKSDGALAVTVVLYGNRAFENALTQLDSFVSERGCKVIAAASFVGEHSYSNSKYPIAAGRPDERDIAFAQTFGEDISRKIAYAKDQDSICAVKAEDIALPEQSQDEMNSFFSEIKQAKIDGIPFPLGPATDENLCTHCGICANNCPIEAIVEGDELNTDYSKCIKCCACIKLCPENARSMDTPYSHYLNKYFGIRKDATVIL